MGQTIAMQLERAVSAAVLVAVAVERQVIVWEFVMLYVSVAVYVLTTVAVYESTTINPASFTR